MSNFVYEPLTAPDAFRLLVLEPGVPEDALCCRILHTTHSRNLDYEALSYTWGSPATGDEPAPTCLIDGKAMPIRRNLYDALRHLRWRDYERVLWIDALCIDQSNVAERNHQVGRMRDIYSNAETVRVWLGLASKTSSIAMSWIDELASRRHRNSLGVPGRLSDYTPESCRRSQTRRWKALLNLLERPYWRRVWIVQEIVLAEKLRLQCGEDESRWEGLVHLLEPRGRKRVFEPRASRDAIGLIRDGLPARIQSLRRVHELRGCRLQEVLEATRGSLYTDPRDRVYGLLGIADDVGDGRFEVDYSGEPNIETMLRGLWKYAVECNKPETVVQSCQYLGQFLHDRGAEKALMMQITASQPRQLYNIKGRAVGKILYLGQPWKSSAEWGKWEIAMGAMHERFTLWEVECRYDKLLHATHELFLSTDYHRLGLVRRKAFSHLFNDREEISVEAPEQKERLNEQAANKSCGKTTTPASFEKQEFEQTAQVHFGNGTGKYTARLTELNVTAFIANNGQMGLVPGNVGAAGVRVGDELCQFRDSDVTAVFRRVANDDPSKLEVRSNTDPSHPGGNPVLVGKGILAKRLHGEGDVDKKLQLRYSRLDDRFALEEAASRYKGWSRSHGIERNTMDDTVTSFDVTGKGLTWLTSW
ncbi:heterokaryon incompatibility 6 OR allele [Apiospora aurea]|uniref:Heterokaryon incompatibility 6 OR allele n=1 Tax=Apiospora aurea TaxID=335848 RepID=A0ABR1QSQ5_9PEZI